MVRVQYLAHLIQVAWLASLTQLAINTDVIMICLPGVEATGAGDTLVQPRTLGAGS